MQGFLQSVEMAALHTDFTLWDDLDGLVFRYFVISSGQLAAVNFSEFHKL